MFFFFFLNDTATTEIYTLPLHDALPISPRPERPARRQRSEGRRKIPRDSHADGQHRDCHELRTDDHNSRDRQHAERSEEHTSELQSQSNLVCRLLLEKKKNKHYRSPRVVPCMVAALDVDIPDIRVNVLSYLYLVECSYEDTDAACSTSIHCILRHALD